MLLVHHTISQLQYILMTNTLQFFAVTLNNTLNRAEHLGVNLIFQTVCNEKLQGCNRACYTNYKGEQQRPFVHRNRYLQANGIVE